MLNESLPNMVAGKGLERNGPPEFNETDFDGWLMFLKAHLGRIGGADDALEEDYPTTVVDEDGEEVDHPNRTQRTELEALQEEWKVKIESAMEPSWMSATRTPTREELPRDARPMLQKPYWRC